MLYVGYFRQGHWHMRLFYVLTHAVSYADSLVLVPGGIRHNIPNY